MFKYSAHKKNHFDFHYIANRALNPQNRCLHAKCTNFYKSHSGKCIYAGRCKQTFKSVSTRKRGGHQYLMFVLPPMLKMEEKLA